LFQQPGGGTEIGLDSGRGRDTIGIRADHRGRRLGM